MKKWVSGQFTSAIVLSKSAPSLSGSRSSWSSCLLATCDMKRKTSACGSAVHSGAIIRRHCSRTQDTFAIPASSKAFLFIDIFRMRPFFLTRPSYVSTTVFLSQAK
jgi:hypothetical protein